MSRESDSRSDQHQEPGREIDGVTEYGEDTEVCILNICNILTPRMYFCVLAAFTGSRGPRVGRPELRVCMPWPLVPNVIREDDKIKPAQLRGRITLQPRRRRAKGRGRRLITRKASDAAAKGGHGQAARSRLRGGRDRRHVGRLEPPAEASIVAGGVEKISFVLVGSTSDRVRRHAVHNPPRTQRAACTADDGRLRRELTDALAQLRARTNAGLAHQ